ncbi:MAG: T9SS type A sorting domain-containing protein [Jejuia sp.]
MKKTYLILISIILFFLHYRTFGQIDFLYSINATGNDISDNNGSVNYSIGQTFYSFTDNNTGYIGEGVQQAFIKLARTNNEDVDNPNDYDTASIDMLIFPNPTTDVVTLSTNGLDLDDNLNSYQLYSYQGKLIANNTIKDKETIIDLTQLNISIYILQVYANEKLWKTFKIIKK